MSAVTSNRILRRVFIHLLYLLHQSGERSTLAYPVWMDTRDKDLVLCPGTGVPGVPPQVCTFTEPNGLLANDEDIYMAKVSVP
jgi:hypothetical protein